MNVDAIIRAASNIAKTQEVRCRIENMGWAPHYSEPGYDNPKRGGVFLSNWNDITHYDGHARHVDDGTMGRLAGALETYGASIEWEDEWTTCCQCQRAIRTQPDSYGWRPAYFMTDDGGVCHNCVAEDPEEYLQSLEGNDRTAWTLDIDPAEHGYVLLEGGFEAGFHPGQNDDPREIAKGLRERGINNFVFRIDANGQFDTEFSVYVPVAKRSPDMRAGLEEGRLEDKSPA